MKEALTYVGRVLGGFALIILAMFIVPLLFIPALIWKIYASISYEDRKARDILTGTARFFVAMAVSIDKFGNCAYGGFFNAVLLKEQKYKFGNTHETISEVLGWGMYFGDLTETGKWLYNVLEWLEENHCEGARLHGLAIARKKLDLIG